MSQGVTLPAYFNGLPLSFHPSLPLSSRLMHIVIEKAPCGIFHCHCLKLSRLYVPLSRSLEHINCVCAFEFKESCAISFTSIASHCLHFSVNCFSSEFSKSITPNNSSSSSRTKIKTPNVPLVEMGFVNCDDVKTNKKYASCGWYWSVVLLIVRARDIIYGTKREKWLFVDIVTRIRSRTIWTWVRKNIAFETLQYLCVLAGWLAAAAATFCFVRLPFGRYYTFCCV